MSKLWLSDSSRLAISEPSLLVPGKPTMQRMRPNWAHPIVRSAREFLYFDGRTDKPNEPINLINNTRWTYSDSGTDTEFVNKTISGVPCISRTDIDLAGRRLYSNIIQNRDDTPFFVMLRVAPLLIPTVTLMGAYQLALSARASSAELYIRLRDTDGFQIGIGLNTRCTIPAVVGEWVNIVIAYNGSTTFFFSNKSVSTNSYTGSHAIQSADHRHFLGAGRGGEVPCAYSMFVTGNYYLPSELFKSWVVNPYQILRPANDSLYLVSSAVAAALPTLSSATAINITSGGFQPRVTATY